MSIYLKPCPICGKQPKVIITLSGSFYVLCFSHAETETRPSTEEAIADWNCGDYERHLSTGRPSLCTRTAVRPIPDGLSKLAGFYCIAHQPQRLAGDHYRQQRIGIRAGDPLSAMGRVIYAPAEAKGVIV